MQRRAIEMVSARFRPPESGAAPATPTESPAVDEEGRAAGAAQAGEASDCCVPNRIPRASRPNAVRSTIPMNTGTMVAVSADG